MAVRPTPQPGATILRLPEPLFLLLVTGGLLGTTFPLGSLAAGGGVPPAVWALLTSGGGAAVLALGLAARRRHLAVAPPYLRFYLGVGLLSYVFPNLLVFASIPHLGAGLTSVMYTLSPILTLALSALLRVRRTSPLAAAGIAVGLAGALLIVFGKGQVDRPAEPFRLALALLIPVTLACGNVFRTLAWPPGADGGVLAIGSNLAAALVLAGVVATTTGLGSLSTLAGPATVTLTQVVCTALMLVFYFRLQVAGGPVYLSQISYVAAAIGLTTGTLLLGETYGAATWFGALVIAAGVGMTTLGQSRT